MLPKSSSCLGKNQAFLSDAFGKNHLTICHPFQVWHPTPQTLFTQVLFFPKALSLDNTFLL